MATKDDGSGCAFSGMTLREYFAAAAMQGILAMHADPEASMPKPNWAAAKSVGFSDALIAELAKEQG